MTLGQRIQIRIEHGLSQEEFAEKLGYTTNAGYEVKGITTLTRALRNFKAGDSTTVTIIRSGGQMELEITLDEKPQAAEPTAPTMPESTEGMPSVGDPGEWFDFYSRFFGNQFGD